MNEDEKTEAPLDPAAMLALVQHQQGEIGRKLAHRIPWILFAWGVAWTLGFLALWLIDGVKPGFSLPLPIAVPVYVALLVGAGVVSAVVGTRANRGIRTTPAAAFTGTVFGITCSTAFLAMCVFAGALVANGMHTDLLNIFYPVMSTLLVGIIYLMAAAIWHSVPTIMLGGWVILVALVAPFFGYPTHYLVFAIAGGGGFFVAWLILLAWVRSGKRSVSA